MKRLTFLPAVIFVACLGIPGTTSIAAEMTFQLVNNTER